VVSGNAEEANRETGDFRQLTCHGADIGPNFWASEAVVTSSGFTAISFTTRKKMRSLR
jgi:hypothetical protein